MAEIGSIKSVKKEGNYIVAVVETGSGAAVTGLIVNPLGAEFFPIKGDIVVFQRTGKEIVLLAGLSANVEGATGEVSLFSRDSTGAKVAEIWLKATKIIEAKNDNGTFSLLANGQFSANGNFTVDP